MLLEATLEQYLHEHIPLSKAMGLRVEVASQERVLLGCPLEPNLNHRGTGFGGSIASIATLAGWSWLWILMRDKSIAAKLVVRKSTIDYIASVDSDFTAELRPPSHEAISHFWETFERRGSARIELKVEVLCRGEEAAHFDGTFVAIRS
jgi:thioesterase domain-containing protein